MLKKKMKRIFLTGLAVVIPAGLTIYILFFIIDMMDNLLQDHPGRLSAGQPVPFSHSRAWGDRHGHPHLHLRSCDDELFWKPACRFWRAYCRQNSFCPEHLSGDQADRRGPLHGQGAEFQEGGHRANIPAAGSTASDSSPARPTVKYRRTWAGELSCVGVYIPCALTPTTGVFVMIPQDELIEVSMSVEEAFTLIISAGIVTPQEHLVPPGAKPVNRSIAVCNGRVTVSKDGQVIRNAL